MQTPGDNIDNFLKKDFNHFNYLPQKLEIVDINQGLYNFIKNLGLSVMDENGLKRAVPIVYTTQELWAERKNNWKSFRNEFGQEITRPFMALTQTGMNQGTSPLKRSIPNKYFQYVKVPIFDGALKDFNIYKIPQPIWVDLDYELVFISHYQKDVDDFRTNIFRAYQSLQGYMNLNGYHISSKITGTSQSKEEEIDSENLTTISVNILVFGKLVDPTLFKKVNTINKVTISISENKKK